MLVGGANVIYAEKYFQFEDFHCVMVNLQSVINAHVRGGKNECNCLKGMYLLKTKSV